MYFNHQLKINHYNIIHVCLIHIFEYNILNSIELIKMEIQATEIFEAAHDNSIFLQS